MHELVKIAEEKNGKKVWKDCLLLGLYYYFPPRRLMDYTEMYVANNASEMDKDILKENRNYYLKDTKEFVFNVYKTSNTYGSVRFKIDNKLAKIIKRYLYEYSDKIDIGDKLIPYSQRQGLSIAIGNLLRNRKMTEKLGRITVGVLRRSFIAFLSKKNDWTKEDERRYCFKNGS